MPEIEVCVENGMQFALPHENEPFVTAHVVVTETLPVPPHSPEKPIIHPVIWLEPLTVMENGWPSEVVPLYVPAGGVMDPIVIEPDLTQLVDSLVTVNCQLYVPAAP